MIGYIRVPKTASMRIDMELRDVACRGHYPYSWFASHGHEHEYVTTIRDPFQTAISFYYMMMRVKDNPDFRKPPLTMDKNPLAFQPQDAENMRLFNEGATLEEWLAAMPKNQFYHYYYDGFDPSQFAFVGRVEEFDRSLSLFQSVLSRGLHVVSDVNVNPDKPMGELYTTTYDEDQFKFENGLDYYAYHGALARFNELCQQYGV